ncbi:uncharacterized protein LOC141600650 [Silene latifolia]|uniref:uncharacterized protein LOC141600650 n=1 Tax=Silene latifolia TaxID=37657 RepID=UPI003D78AD27
MGNQKNFEEEVSETLRREGATSQPLFDVDDLEVLVDEDNEEDSDDLRSLQGSDDEIDDNSPTFNSLTDFKGPIKLVAGFKFANNKILRQALVQHSIEKGYDFYYTHNGNKRVTVKCRFKCKCPWNSKKSKFIGPCKCPKSVKKCLFKLHATNWKDSEEIFQIKTLIERHICGMATHNRKVTSEYLAEKKRTKLIIYGNGKDQYGRVWDYVAEVRKSNEGSSAFVVCDNIDRPSPIFKRLYIYLQACKEGFLKGCRPILGVDGCHLRGPYPGICLVAVGKDVNNNIFSIAWAVVEVENTDSWKWFLELLAIDLGHDEGLRLTFMSDRQKGLVDTLKFVVPKAEIRFCARHVWANFKLTWS